MAMKINPPKKDKPEVIGQETISSGGSPLKINKPKASQPNQADSFGEPSESSFPELDYRQADYLRNLDQWGRIRPAEQGLHPVDLEDFDKWISDNEDIRDLENLYGSVSFAAAERQSGWYLAGAAATQAVLGHMVGGTISGVGYLLDPVGTIKKLFSDSDDPYTSWGDENLLTRLGNSITDWTMEEAMPIHQTKKAAEGWAPSDATWWASQFPSMFSSVSMIIPTFAAAKAIGGVAKLMRVAQKMSKHSKIATDVIGRSLMSRTIYSNTESIDLFKTTYEDSIQKGMSDLEARQRAGNAAAYNFRIGYANIWQDMLQWGMIMRAPMFATRSTKHKLVDIAKQTPKDSATRTIAGVGQKGMTRGARVSRAIEGAVGQNPRQLLAHGLLQGFEEYNIQWQKKEGSRYAERLAEDPQAAGMFSADQWEGFGERLAEHTLDRHTWDSTFWGTMGGFVFGSLSGAMQRHVMAPGQIKAERDQMKSLMDRAERINSDIKAWSAFTAKGDKYAAQNVLDGMVLDNAYKSAQEGTLSINKEIMDQVSRMSDQELETLGWDTSIKEEASKMLNKLEKFEGIYNREVNRTDGTKESDLLAHKRIVNDYKLWDAKESLATIEAELSQKESELQYSENIQDSTKELIKLKRLVEANQRYVAELIQTRNSAAEEYKALGGNIIQKTILKALDNMQNLQTQITELESELNTEFQELDSESVKENKNLIAQTEKELKNQKDKEFFDLSEIDQLSYAFSRADLAKRNWQEAYDNFSDPEVQREYLKSVQEYEDNLKKTFNATEIDTEEIRNALVLNEEFTDKDGRPGSHTVKGDFEVTLIDKEGRPTRRIARFEEINSKGNITAYLYDQDGNLSNKKTYFNKDTRTGGEISDMKWGYEGPVHGQQFLMRSQVYKRFVGALENFQKSTKERHTRYRDKLTALNSVKEKVTSSIRAIKEGEVRQAEAALELNETEASIVEEFLNLKVQQLNNLEELQKVDSQLDKLISDISAHSESIETFLEQIPDAVSNYNPEAVRHLREYLSQQEAEIRTIHDNALSNKEELQKVIEDLENELAPVRKALEKVRKRGEKTPYQSTRVKDYIFNRLNERNLQARLQQKEEELSRIEEDLQSFEQAVTEIEQSRRALDNLDKMWSDLYGDLVGQARPYGTGKFKPIKKSPESSMNQVQRDRDFISPMKPFRGTAEAFFSTTTNEETLIRGIQQENKTEFEPQLLFQRFIDNFVFHEEGTAGHVKMKLLNREQLLDLIEAEVNSETDAQIAYKDNLIRYAAQSFMENGIFVVPVKQSGKNWVPVKQESNFDGGSVPMFSALNEAFDTKGNLQIEYSDGELLVTRPTTGWAFIDATTRVHEYVNKQGISKEEAMAKVREELEAAGEEYKETIINPVRQGEELLLDVESISTGELNIDPKTEARPVSEALDQKLENVEVVVAKDKKTSFGNNFYNTSPGSVYINYKNRLIPVQREKLQSPDIDKIVRLLKHGLEAKPGEKQTLDNVIDELKKITYTVYNSDNTGSQYNFFIVEDKKTLTAGVQIGNQFIPKSDILGDNPTALRELRVFLSNKYYQIDSSLLENSKKTIEFKDVKDGKLVTTEKVNYRDWVLKDTETSPAKIKVQLPAHKTDLENLVNPAFKNRSFSLTDNKDRNATIEKKQARARKQKIQDTSKIKKPKRKQLSKINKAFKDLGLSVKAEVAEISEKGGDTFFIWYNPDTATAMMAEKSDVVKKQSKGKFTGYTIKKEVSIKDYLRNNGITADTIESVEDASLRHIAEAYFSEIQPVEQQLSELLTPVETETTTKTTSDETALPTQEEDQIPAEWADSERTLTAEDVVNQQKAEQREQQKEDFEKPSSLPDKPSKFDIDLDMAYEAPFTSEERIDIVRELEEVQKMFPHLTIKEIVEHGLIDNYAQARYISEQDGASYLVVSRLASRGALFHEAFHEFATRFLTETDYQNLINETLNLVGDRTYTIRDQKIKFSELQKKLSQQEFNNYVEEFLAEEFRNFMLAGKGNYTFGQAHRKKNFFEKAWDAIINLFERFLGRPVRSHNEVHKLFQEIRAGRWSEDMVARRPRVTADRVGNLSEADSTVLVKNLNYIFLNNLFKDSIREQVDLTNPSDYVQDLYNSIYNTLKRRAESQDNPVFNVMVNRWNDLQREHLKFLRHYQIQAEIDFDTVNTDDRTSRNNSDYVQSNKIDITSYLPIDVQLLIASLPGGTEMLSGVAGTETAITARPVTVDYAGTKAYLHKNLANMEIANIPLKLAELAQRHDEYKVLLSRLGFSEDGVLLPSATQKQVELANRFFNQMAKADTDMITTAIGDRGAYNISEESATRRNRMVEKWRNNLKGTQLNRLFDFAQGKFKLNSKKSLKLAGMKEAKTFEELIQRNPLSSTTPNKAPKFRREFLDMFGIEIPTGFGEIKTLNDTIEYLAYHLRGLIKEGGDIFADDIFNRRVLSIRKELNKLSDEISQFEENFVDNNIRTHKGTQYAITLKNHLHRIVERFKDPNYTYPEMIPFKNGEGNVGTYISDWAKRIMNGEVPQIKLISSIGEEVGDKVDISDAKPGDLSLMEVINILDGTIPFMRSESRKLEYAFAWGKDYIDKNLTLEKQLTTYRDYLKAELVYAMAFKANPQFNRFAQKNDANQLRFFKDIVPESVNKALDNLDVSEDSTTWETEAERLINSDLEAINNSLTDYITEARNALFERFANQSLIVPRANDYQLGTLPLDAISEFVEAKVDEGVVSIDESQLNKVLDIVNHYYTIGNIEQTKLITGDLSIYTDGKKSTIHKRSTTFTSTKHDSNNASWFIDFLNSQYERLDGTPHSRIRKDFVFADPKVRSKYYDIYKEYIEEIGAYAAMDEADGFTFSTLDGHRSALLRASIWNENYDRTWNYEAQYGFRKAQEWEVQNRSKEDRIWTDERFKELFGKHLPEKFARNKFYYKGEEINISQVRENPLPAEKFQGTGQILNENLASANRMDITKTAIGPMLPTVIADSQLFHLWRESTEQGLDFLSMSTARKGDKLGNSEGQLPSLYNTNEDGNTTIASINSLLEGDYIPTELSWSDVGRQLEIDPSGKRRVTASKQERRLIAINTHDGGIISDRMKPYKTTIENLHTFEKVLVRRGLDSFLNRTGYEMSEGGLRLAEIEKLTEAIHREVKSRQVPDNVVDGVDLVLNSSVILFDTLPNKRQLVNLLHGMFRKNVISLKKSGDMLVQIPSTGLEQNRVSSNLDGVSVLSSNMLEFYRPVNKKGELTGKQSEVVEVLPAQAHFTLPPQFIPYVENNYTGATFQEKLDKFNNDIATKGIFKEIRTYLANRIPGQNLNSIEVLEITKFLSPSLGSTIVLPTEIVSKTGSDFDIDKLVTYFNNIRIHPQTGNPTYTNYLTEENSTLTERAERIFYSAEDISRLVSNKEATLEYIKDLRKSFADIYKLKEFSEIANPNIIELRRQIDEATSDIEAGELILRLRDEFIATGLGRGLKVKHLEDRINKLAEAKKDVIKQIGEVIDGLPIIEQNTRAAIENRSNELHKELLLAPENFASLIRPNSSQLISELADNLNFIDEAVPKHRLHQLDYNLSVAENQWNAVALVGILAVHNTSHSMFQQSPMRVSSNMFKILFSEFEGESGDYSLGRITDNDGLDIGNTISSLLTAAVDAGRETFPSIFRINFTSSTAGAWMLLNTVGRGKASPMGFKKLAKFFTSKPIMQFEQLSRLQEGKAINNTDFKIPKREAVNAVLAELNQLNEHVEDKKMLYQRVEDVVNATNEADRQDAQAALQKDLNDRSLISAKDYNTRAFDTLDTFLYYVELAKQLRVLQQVTRPDAGLPQNSLDLKLHQEQEIKLKNLGLFYSNDIDRFYRNTFVGEFKNAHDSAYKAFSGFELSNLSDTIFDTLWDADAGLYRIYSNPAANYTHDKLFSTLQKLQNAIISGIVHTTTHNNKTLMDRYEHLMRGKNSVAQRAFELSKLEEFENNPVFQELVPVLNEFIDKRQKNIGIDYVKVFNNTRKVEDANAITRAFRELSEHPDAKVQQFINDLIDVSIIQSGVQITPISFFELIPAELYQQRMQTILQGYLRGENSFIHNNGFTQAFLDKIFTNLRADSNVVPRQSPYYKTVRDNTVKYGPISNDNFKTIKVGQNYENANFPYLSVELQTVTKAQRRKLKAQGKLIPKELAVFKDTGRTTKPNTNGRVYKIYQRIPNVGEPGKFFEMGKESIIPHHRAGEQFESDGIFNRESTSDRATPTTQQTGQTTREVSDTEGMSEELRRDIEAARAQNEDAPFAPQRARGEQDIEIRSKFFPKSRNTSASAVLERIAKSDHPLKLLAEHLKNHIVNDMEIELVPKRHLGRMQFADGSDGTVAGTYYPSLNSIEVAEFAKFPAGQSEALILHEIIHGLTTNVLETNSKAAKDLKTLYKYALSRSQNKELYGFKNEAEFVTELFTNSDFIQELQSIAPNRDVRKYNNLWEQLLDFFLGLVGIGPKQSNLYTQAFSVATNVIQEHTETTPRKQVEVLPSTVVPRDISDTVLNEYINLNNIQFNSPIYYAGEILSNYKQGQAISKFTDFIADNSIRDQFTAEDLTFLLGVLEDAPIRKKLLHEVKKTKHYKENISNFVEYFDQYQNGEVGATIQLAAEVIEQYYAGENLLGPELTNIVRTLEKHIKSTFAAEKIIQGKALQNLRNELDKAVPQPTPEDLFADSGYDSASYTQGRLQTLDDVYLTRKRLQKQAEEAAQNEGQWVVSEDITSTPDSDLSQLAESEADMERSENRVVENTQELQKTQELGTQLELNFAEAMKEEFSMLQGIPEYEVSQIVNMVKQGRLQIIC